MHEPTAPIRYLSSSQVRSLLPGIDDQLGLVRQAYRAVRRGDCQTPSLPELTPRPDGFTHALPAYIPDGDISSIKWVCGNSGNRGRGLPYISGLIVISDSATGRPVAVLDAAMITVARTAAASAVCVEAFARDEWSTVAIIGHGLQSRAHIEALSALNPEATFKVFSRRSPDPGGGLEPAPDPRSAAEGADVLVTGIPLEAKLDPQVSFDWLTPAALVLPLDDHASLAADVANRASTFLVDSLDDFAVRQRHGIFADWREPDGSVPESILGGRTTEGVTVCANQGIGVLDAVFAQFVVDAAERADAGALLDR